MNGQTSILDMIEAMESADIPAEKILIAVKEASRKLAAKEEARLEGQRERTQRYREKCNVTKRDVALHTVTHVTSPPSSPDPLMVSPIPPSLNPITLSSSPKENPPKGGQKKGAEEFILPAWVPVESWEAFMEVRKKLGAVQSPRALNGLVRRLERWMNLGHDPTEMIEKSIRNSWKDIFEPKEQNGKPTSGTQAKPSAHTAFAEGVYRFVTEQ